MATDKKNKFRGNDPVETMVEVEERSLERNDIEDVVKKPLERKNKPKTQPKVSETEPAPVKQTTPSKQKTDFKTRIQQVLAFYTDERTQKILGLLLILFSAYLSIAFVSYFTSWDVDQDKVLGNRADLFLP